MSIVKLEFPKSETRLAGFPYGVSVYEKQAKDYVSYDGEIRIIFPEQIEKVASSFVQGFFAELVDKIGYKGIERQVIIEAGTEVLVNEIRKNIY